MERQELAGWINYQLNNIKHVFKKKKNDLVAVLNYLASLC